MIGSSLTPPSAIWACRDSSVRRAPLAPSAFSFAWFWRKCAIWRALAASVSAWKASPGCGRPPRPRTSTGVAGPARLQLPAAIVDERPDLADDRARDERIADAQRAVLNQDGRDGPAALVELRFEHRPRRVALGIGLELAQLGDQQHHLEQQLEVLLLLRGDLDHDGRATPLFRGQAEIRELLLDAIRIGFRLVDLVDRHQDRHAGRLRVIDGFTRLRHDAVVGGHHQDDDVGDARATGTHHREGFVARGVEEHDVAVVHLHRVGADVLGDPAGLALRDPRRANRVEQRRLAVIDVAHDGDHRRARDLVLGVDLLGLDLQQLLFEALHLDVSTEVPRDHRRGLVVERAVDGHHHAALDQFLEDVLGLDVQFRCEISDSHTFGERDRPRHRRRCGRRGRNWCDAVL